MAIYKTYQDKRQQIAGQANPYYNKWYGKAVHLPRPVDTLELARRVQKNVSVKASDVYAVLREASDVINVALLNSERVILDGIGSFKASISTLPADTEAQFRADTNIKRSRIIFTPELDPERTVAKSRADKTLLRGIRWDKASTIIASAPVDPSLEPNAPTVSPTSGGSPLAVRVTGLIEGAVLQRRKGSGNWIQIVADTEDAYDDIINDPAGGTFYYRQVVNGIESPASVGVVVDPVMP